MDRDDDFFGGFADIAGEISPQAVGEPMPLEDDDTVSDANKGIMAVDPADIIGDDKPEEDLETIENPTDTGEEEGAQEEEVEEQEEQEEEEVVEEVVEETSEEEEEVEDLSKVESDISRYFTEKLAESLGVDIEEEDKFDNANDVVDFMRQLVEDNSKPVFANEDIEKLNQFVEDGGELKEYFQQTFGDVDLDSIDLSSEGSQKTVIREFLKTEGYSTERIDRRIQRYEEAGTLEEEAEDAKELLSEYKQKNSEKLLDDQKKVADTRRNQQQKFINDVQSNVKALKNVRGIPVSDGERKQLLDYIFTPDSEGITQYQRDYAKDVNNLIESAYFTMKGDTLIQKIQNKATSNAVKTIKTKLESKGKRTKSVKGQEESVSDLEVLTRASKFLSKR